MQCLALSQVRSGREKCTEGTISLDLLLPVSLAVLEVLKARFALEKLHSVREKRAMVAAAVLGLKRATEDSNSEKYL